MPIRDKERRNDRIRVEGYGSRKAQVTRPDRRCALWTCSLVGLLFQYSLRKEDVMQPALTLYTNGDYRWFSLGWFIGGVGFALCCVGFRKMQMHGYHFDQPFKQTGLCELLLSAVLLFGGWFSVIVGSLSTPHVIETITLEPDERVLEIYPKEFHGNAGARIVTQTGDYYVFRDVVLPRGKEHKDLKLFKLTPIQAE